MGDHQSSKSHSPLVRFWIETDGKHDPLSQCGGEWVIPKDGVKLPTGPAIIVSEIDGRPYRRAVTLPADRPSDSLFVPVEDHQSPRVAAG